MTKNFGSKAEEGSSKGVRFRTAVKSFHHVAFELDALAVMESVGHFLGLEPRFASGPALD